MGGFGGEGAARYCPKEYGLDGPANQEMNEREWEWDEAQTSKVYSCWRKLCVDGSELTNGKSFATMAAELVRN